MYLTEHRDDVGFKRLQTDPAKVAVSTSAIVEHLDVVVDLSPRDLPRCVDALLDPLLLQAAKKCSATALSQQLPRRLILGSR